MTNIVEQVGYTFIDYDAEFHMKHKHLFMDSVYDSEYLPDYPLIITWAETDMKLEDRTNKCLAIATKVSYYKDILKLSQDVFEDLLIAYVLFPEDNEESRELRLNYARAILNT